MADQKYESKSFILSFKSHSEEDKKPYSYYVKKDEKFGGSMICLLVEKIASKIEKKEEDMFDVRVVLHSDEDFSKGQASYEEDVASFAQKFFPNPKKAGKKNTIKEWFKENYFPIIHLTLDDSYLDNLYSEENTNLPSEISRSYQILDSSIWNKIVPYDRSEAYKVGGDKGLDDAIGEIEKYYKRGLYNLEVACEYANLNARLAQQAFLAGSHTRGVSPFIFHSESAIKLLVNREFRDERTTSNSSKSLIEIIKEYKWRILLVDDKATEDLSPVGKNEKIIEKRSDGLPWNSKLAIIIDVLESLFLDSSQKSEFSISCEEEDAEKSGIFVEYAKNKKDAEELLKVRKYDLILLDYLLENNGVSEYGYELLDDICKEVKKSTNEGSGIIDFDNVAYQIGPHEKLFFMFISAYTTAVHERLLAEGLNRNEKYWYIGEGACPTNTPELFKYRLLHIMDRRLDQTGIKSLSYENILNVVKRIYERGEGSQKKRVRITSVRGRANEAYHKILGFHYDYFLLRDKDKGKSALVDSFLKGKEHFGAMLEHLLQLVHLTAFGTVRQWPEIWEECQFLMRTIDDNKKSSIKSLKNEIVAAIESYVIDLKSE